MLPLFGCRAEPACVRGGGCVAVKQMWMSHDTGGQSRHGLRTLGGILEIVVLMLALICGGTVLGVSMGWPMKPFSLLLCAGATALTAVLAAGLGRRSVGDTTVFFLTEEDRLFVVDARDWIDHGGTIVSYGRGVMETQQLLRSLARSSSLPSGADEILKVLVLRENASHYALTCQVLLRQRWESRRTYFLVKGMEDQEMLLRQLERREGQTGGPEEEENRKPVFFLVSVLICCGFGLLCVLSHPAVARLPQSIYFPCLGGAFGALCAAVCFGVRQRRGD